VEKWIHCGQFILGKISQFDAARRQILRQKCPKFDFRCGSAPDPAGGAYSVPPDPLAIFKGPTSKGGGKGRKREWEGKGKRGEGKGFGRPVSNCLLLAPVTVTVYVGGAESRQAELGAPERGPARTHLSG